MTYTVTIPVVAQRIEVLPGRFEVVTADVADRTALVRVDAPDGPAVVRSAPDGGWRALFSGASAHDLDVPGMTVSILAPLSAAGVSIFVASTTTADLVLVPDDALEHALARLREAGHSVVPTSAD